MPCAGRIWGHSHSCHWGIPTTLQQPIPCPRGQNIPWSWPPGPASPVETAHKPLADPLVAGRWLAADPGAGALQEPGRCQDPVPGSAAAEATAAPQAGLALCLQPGELIQPLTHCSLPCLQTHTGPHAVWVIQAHKGVIKIHSKLMSTISVLMSAPERHSRSWGRRTLISPL